MTALSEFDLGQIKILNTIGFSRLDDSKYISLKYGMSIIFSVRLDEGKSLFSVSCTHFGKPKFKWFDTFEDATQFSKSVFFHIDRYIALILTINGAIEIKTTLDKFDLEKSYKTRINRLIADLNKSKISVGEHLFWNQP